MKKYLLAVLALGAMTMVACNPANNEPAPAPAPAADYAINTTACGEIMATLDCYGDVYEVGNNVYMLQMMGVDDWENTTKLQILALQYNTPIDEFNGCGVLVADVIGAEGYYSFAANTFTPGYVDPEDPEYMYGSGYFELDYETGDYTVFECVTGGTMTVTYNEETQENTFSGTLVLASGKTLAVEYTGLVGGGIAPMKAALKAEKFARSFSSLLKK